ncbi:MAG: hypothetical protein ABIM98_06910 [candidate division WOR-3 bacterium]
MEPAEAIVNVWLQMKGYFTMNNIRVGESGSGKGGKKPEIDILAVKLNPSCNKIEEKIHIEVTVAVNPFGRWTKKIAEKHIAKFENKCRVDEIKKYFGKGEYEKMLVISDQCLTDEVESYLKDRGIECRKFSEIISELRKLMENKAFDDTTRRFLGLIFKHDKKEKIKKINPDRLIKKEK